MPRKTFMSWRVNKNEGDTSEDHELQTVALYRKPRRAEKVDKEEDTWETGWITVARGSKEILDDICKQLNATRFQVFDLTPPPPLPKEEK